MAQFSKTSLLDASTMAADDEPIARPARRIDLRKAGMIALVILSLGVVTFVVGRTVNRYRSSPDVQSRYRTLVDSETGEVFVDFKVPTGSTFPIKNPKSGKPTLYMGEPCYWTKDGKAKLEPTWVLVKQSIGLPGPTICPDCGRKVVPHNPTPPDELMIEAAQRAAGK